jgi:hypothetical protein
MTKLHAPQIRNLKAMRWAAYEQAEPTPQHAFLPAEFMLRHQLLPELEYTGNEPLSVGQWHAREVSYGILAMIAFSCLTQDWNKVHYSRPSKVAQGPLRGYAVAGLLLAGCFSGILAGVLPGHGTIYASHALKFLRPARLYRKYVAFVKVRSIDARKHRVVLDCVIDDPVRPTDCRSAVCTGEADVRNYSSEFIGDNTAAGNSAAQARSSNRLQSEKRVS